MKTVFVIHNSEGTFLGKQGQWLSPEEAQAVWRSPHHDVALNQLIEANAREIMLRLQIMSCPLSERDVPLLQQAVVPKKMAAIQFDDEAAEGADQAKTSDDEALDDAAEGADCADSEAGEGVDSEPATADLFAEPVVSDAAEVRAPEFAQTTAADPVVIAGELETTDYSNSTER